MQNIKIRKKIQTITKVTVFCHKIKTKALIRMFSIHTQNLVHASEILSVILVFNK